MVSIKSVTLKDNNDVVSSSNIWWQFVPTYSMSLKWTVEYNKYIDNNSSYGDACISQNSFLSDGNLLVSVGWSDGFGLRRINDNGTITYLTGKSTPISSKTTYHNFAIDRVHHKAYVGSYNISNIGVCDYSEYTSGTQNPQVHYSTVIPDGAQSGYPYSNGFAIVGDYLYMGSYSKNDNKCYRYNLSNSTSENITSSNSLQTGYRGTVWYDKDNDRIYISYYYNTGIRVIVNPNKSKTDAQ
jgi:hypothetical protein